MPVPTHDGPYFNRIARASHYLDLPAGFGGQIRRQGESAPIPTTPHKEADMSSDMDPVELRSLVREACTDVIRGLVWPIRKAVEGTVAQADLLACLAQMRDILDSLEQQVQGENTRSAKVNEPSVQERAREVDPTVLANFEAQWSRFRQLIQQIQEQGVPATHEQAARASREKASHEAAVEERLRAIRTALRQPKPGWARIS